MGYGKYIVILVATLFSFQSVQASANNVQKLDAASEGLKFLFPTQEDQRLIDKDVAVAKKTAAKWLWRFEKEGDQLALRINGKVHYKFKQIDKTSRSYEINGKNFVFSKGLSYNNFRKQWMKSFEKKQALFEHLLIPKAYAVWFPTALVIMGGKIANDEFNKTSKGQCMKSFCAGPYGVFRKQHFQKRGYSSQYHRTKKYHGACYGRLRLIARNYKYGQRFSKKSPSNPIGACMAKKTKFSGGDWGLTPDAAMANCTAAYQCLVGPVPVVAAPTPFQPICTVDKHGRPGPGCPQGGVPAAPTPFQPICTVDKHGNPGPGCPAPAPVVSPPPTPFSVPATGPDKTGSRD